MGTQCGLRLLRRAGCFILLLVLSQTGVRRASAQQLLGSIEGTVTDPSGAAIAKVSVKARNLDTNLELTTTSNNSGAYRFFNLPIGRYSVTFTSPNFQLEEHRPVQVLANRTATESA